MPTPDLLVNAVPLDAYVTSSKSVEWYTPKDIVEYVLNTLGQIDLDPCSNPEKSIPAIRHFTKEDDGLKQTWEGRVFMNPPYGRVIDKWVKKLVSEHERGAVTEAIALVPARTETQWFRRFVDYPVCFKHGRLKFHNPYEIRNSATFPSALVYLGQGLNRFYEVFKDIGDIRIPYRPVN